MGWERNRALCRGGPRAPPYPLARAGPARFLSALGADARGALLHEDHLHLHPARRGPRSAAGGRRKGRAALRTSAVVPLRRAVRPPRPGRLLRPPQRHPPPPLLPTQTLPLSPASP